MKQFSQFSQFWRFILEPLIAMLRLFGINLTTFSSFFCLNINGKILKFGVLDPRHKFPLFGDSFQNPWKHYQCHLESTLPYLNQSFVGRNEKILKFSVLDPRHNFFLFSEFIQESKNTLLGLFATHLTKFNLVVSREYESPTS